MDRSEFSVGLAAKFVGAWAEAGGTTTELNVLAENSDQLGQVIAVQRNFAKIKPIECLIDCDAPPFIPYGWSVLPDNEQLPNRVQGALKWDKIKLSLHLDKSQKGKEQLVGHKLRKVLGKERVLTANVLDYFLKPENQHLIPEEWKEKTNGNTTFIFFWGTIYRHSGGDLCVRCLDWYGAPWGWRYLWLDGDWNADYPAAVLAS